MTCGGCFSSTKLLHTHTHTHCVTGGIVLINAHLDDNEQLLGELVSETHKLVPGDQVLGQNGGQLLAHLSVAP